MDHRTEAEEGESREPGMSMQTRGTDGAPPLTKLLHPLVLKYCLDLRGDIGNILQYPFISCILFSNTRIK